MMSVDQCITYEATKTSTRSAPQKARRSSMTANELLYLFTKPGTSSKRACPDGISEEVDVPIKKQCDVFDRGSSSHTSTSSNGSDIQHEPVSIIPCMPCLHLATTKGGIRCRLKGSERSSRCHNCIRRHQKCAKVPENFSSRVTDIWAQYLASGKSSFGVLKEVESDICAYEKAGSQAHRIAGAGDKNGPPVGETILVDTGSRFNLDISPPKSGGDGCASQQPASDSKLNTATLPSAPSENSTGFKQRLQRDQNKPIEKAFHAGLTLDSKSLETAGIKSKNSDPTQRTLSLVRGAFHAGLELAREHFGNGCDEAFPVQLAEDAFQSGLAIAHQMRNRPLSQ